MDIRVKRKHIDAMNGCFYYDAHDRHLKRTRYIASLLIAPPILVGVSSKLLDP
jgi:hypothetical protein